jgi:predicted Zn-dependent protease
MRFVFLLFALLIYIPSSHAYIRDDEIESILAEIAHPILKVAGLPAQHTNIYILNDNQVNAFVLGADGVFTYMLDCY